MKHLLAFLISGCLHDWEIIDKHPAKYSGFFRRGHYVKYVLQCKECSDLKVVNVGLPFFY